MSYIRLNIFIHSFSSHAYHIDIKFESQLWFKSNANYFFRLCINNAFRGIKLKVFIQNLWQISLIFCIVFYFSSILVVFRSHLKFNKNIAVASIVDSCLQCLVESHSYCSKINIWRRYLNSSIASSSYNFQCIFFDKTGLWKLLLLLLSLYWKNILACRFIIFKIFVH